MLRIASIATAAAFAAVSFAPAATAQNETMNLNIRIDEAAIVDATSAQKALRSVERQADRACTYKVTALRRTYTDEVCVAEIVSQVVAQIDNENLTQAYAANQGAVQIAENKKQ